MFNETDIIQATNHLAKAASLVAADYQAGDVAGEEDFSGQLAGRLKQSLDGYETPGVRWGCANSLPDVTGSIWTPTIRLSARQTSKTTEEPETGADLLMVLDIRSSAYTIQKGVLIQAKRLERGAQLPNAISIKLRQQCNAMLANSCASYVFLYSNSGIATLSASVVVGSIRRDLHALEQYTSSTKVFLYDFLLCWIGDPRLKATDAKSLEELRAAERARHAVLITAEDKTSGRPRE